MEDKTELLRARQEAERHYARLGIPYRFWDVTLKELRFRRCAFPVVPKAKALPAAQRSALKQVIAEPRRQLICIGSVETDEAALAAACSVLCQAYDDGHRISLVDAQFSQKRLPDRLSIYAVHNITQESTADRIEAVRDLLVRYRTARLVVVAGCKDPYRWCQQRLRLAPDFVCHLVD